jgi:hypothetical protein
MTTVATLHPDVTRSALIRTAADRITNAATTAHGLDNATQRAVMVALADCLADLRALGVTP